MNGSDQLNKLYCGHETQYRRSYYTPLLSPCTTCTTCGSCERFPHNFWDCSRNTFPTCGGSMWAQGLVQCP